ncbi:MAG: hypothetical protein JXA11_07850 [Phycisphaerae bacterium]|nr:hypothetical protein [Phycisphaerae bacterium]
MPVSRILKKNTTIPAGKKQLSAAPAAPGGDVPATPAKAKILSRADGHVVIQVVCSCGQTIQLRCATGASA